MLRLVSHRRHTKIRGERAARCDVATYLPGRGWRLIKNYRGLDQWLILHLVSALIYRLSKWEGGRFNLWYLGYALAWPLPNRKCKFWFSFFALRFWNFDLKSSERIRDIKNFAANPTSTPGIQMGDNAYEARIHAIFNVHPKIERNHYLSLILHHCTSAMLIFFVSFQFSSQRDPILHSSLQFRKMKQEF